MHERGNVLAILSDVAFTNFLQLWGLEGEASRDESVGDEEDDGEYCAEG